MKQIRCLYSALTENFHPVPTMTTKPYTKWGFKKVGGEGEKSAKHVMQFAEGQCTGIDTCNCNIKVLSKFGNFV